MKFIYKKYDEKAALKQLQERILNAETTIIITEAMDKAAHEMKGQKLTKRYANKIQDILGDEFKVSYVKQYGMFYLFIRHNNLTDNKAQIMIGYESGEADNIINPAIIETRARAYYLDKERLPKLKQAIKEMPDFVKRMQKAQDEIKSVYKDAEKLGVQYLIETK